MPHALFLGSALAGVDRLNMLPRPPKRRREPINNRLPALNPAAAIRRRLRPQRQETDPEIPLENVEGCEPTVASTSAVPPQLNLVKTTDKDDEYEAKMEVYEKAIRKFDRIRWVNLHVWHASVDTAYSLLGFALTINSSILTLAGATFFYGDTGASSDDADLSGAHRLVSDYVGNAAGIIFALALLCAGQSASITATLAGQIVSEGFLEWKTSPMVRRLITRLIGVVPAAIVASAVGNKGLNTMLVASQVILCIVLPTVTIPLVYMCGRKDIMVVEGPVDEDPTPSNDSREDERNKTNEVEEREELELDIADSRGCAAGPSRRPVSPSSLLPRHSAPPTRVPSPNVTRDEEPAPGRRRKYYTSPKWYSGLGWLLNLVLVLANGYVIVTLAMGQS
jgi:metal iron transporter